MASTSLAPRHPSTAQLVSLTATGSNWHAKRAVKRCLNQPPHARIPQPILTVGAATIAGFAQSQVSPIFLVSASFL